MTAPLHRSLGSLPTKGSSYFLSRWGGPQDPHQLLQYTCDAVEARARTITCSVLALLGPVLQPFRWPTKIDLLHNQLARCL
jgi:hypothetical protein